MKRLFWATILLTLAVLGLQAQSTWRGQAELWQGSEVPSGGLVAASNDFTKNSLVTIENYKTKKTVQVRIVSGLPPGSSAFILVSPRVAEALAMGTGETPLVGVQLDTSIGGSKALVEDSVQNPDPDVNPLAGAKPKVAEKPKAVETPKTTDVPKVVETVDTPKVEVTAKVDPNTKVADTTQTTQAPKVPETPKVSTESPKVAVTTPPPVSEFPTPVLDNPDTATKVADTTTKVADKEPVVPAPVALVSASPAAKTPTETVNIPTTLKPQAWTPATVARVTGNTTNPLELTQATTALDPDLVPLPALDAPPIGTATLAMKDIEDDTAPVTPGRRVFLPSTGTGAVTDETNTVEETTTDTTTNDTTDTTDEAAKADALAKAEEAAKAEAAAKAEEAAKADALAKADEAAKAQAAAQAEAAAKADALAKAEEAAKTEAAAKADAAAKAEALAKADAAAKAQAAATAASLGAATVVAPSPAASSAWVSVPGKLTGPVLGTIGLLAKLEKGKAYVQVAAFATEAEMLGALDSLQSYVPVSLYKAEGEKNPWRILVDSAPKSQMGVLIMQFRSQGYRNAALVKG